MEDQLLLLQMYRTLDKFSRPYNPGPSASSSQFPRSPVRIAINVSETTATELKKHRRYHIDIQYTCNLCDKMFLDYMHYAGT